MAGGSSEEETGCRLDASSNIINYKYMQCLYHSVYSALHSALPETFLLESKEGCNLDVLLGFMARSRCNNITLPTNVTNC